MPHSVHLVAEYFNCKITKSICTILANLPKTSKCMFFPGVQILLFKTQLGPGPAMHAYAAPIYPMNGLQSRLSHHQHHLPLKGLKLASWREGGREGGREEAEAAVAAAGRVHSQRGKSLINMPPFRRWSCYRLPVLLRIVLFPASGYNSDLVV